MSERHEQSNARAARRRALHSPRDIEQARRVEGSLLGLMPGRLKLSELTYTGVSELFQAEINLYGDTSMGSEMLAYGPHDPVQEREWSASLLTDMFNAEAATQPDLFKGVTAVKLRVGNQEIPHIAFYGDGSPDEITAISDKLIARTNAVFIDRDLPDRLPEFPQETI